MIRITLPADLAAKAGMSEVLVREDENDILYCYPPDGGDELRYFSWNDFGVIRDLYDRAKGRQLAVNHEALARAGEARGPSKKRRKVKREDDRDRGREGSKYEET